MELKGHSPQAINEAVQAESRRLHENWRQIEDSPLPPPATCTEDELAAAIDHTNLKAEATPEDIERLCDQARRHHFAAVCVNSSFVPLCARRLEGSRVKVCTVAGFPLGCDSTASKVANAREAVAAGALEVDMVQHIGLLLAGELAAVYEDIRAVVEAVAQANPRAHVKVILENCLLDDDRIIQACLLAKAAGAAFVKTSTGFGSGGARAIDVRLMRMVVGHELGVKAAGGIRDLTTARKLMGAGANRLGASASLAILQEIHDREHRSED